MISASQIIHRDVLGSVMDRDCTDHFPQQCWMCGGESTRGIMVGKWMGATYTGQNKVRFPQGDWVCEACVLVCARSTPVPGRPAKPGMQFGPNWRNFSHLYDAGSYVNASKGDKPTILQWLQSSHAGPWFAAIADSGQKHVVPWAPINPPGARRGDVLFEEAVIKLPVVGSAEWDIVPMIADLLTAGAPKGELETGHFTPRAWSLCERGLYVFEREWGRPLRGSAWFALALWLAQRDEEQVQKRLGSEKAKRKVDGKTHAGRKGSAHHPDRGNTAGDSESIPCEPRRESAQELGHAYVKAQDRVKNIAESERVGDVHARSDEHRKRAVGEQLTLFS